MRPGEIVPSAGPTPVAPGGRTGSVRIRNSGRFPAFLGSHFPLVRASRALEFSRAGLEGARLDLPAGATIRIGAGEERELTIRWT
jgi:urease beta subunit